VTPAFCLPSAARKSTPHTISVYQVAVPSTVEYTAIILRYRRKLAGLSLTSFARELGITVAALRRYEAAQEPIPSALLERMAEVFGCPVSEFFTEAPKLH